MFARKYRLPYYIRFQNSHILTALPFTIKLKKNDLLYNRYSVVVGKSIDKRAIKRNRLKRQIRSCIEAIHPKIHQGYDMIILTKKTALARSTESLYQDLITIYKKQSLL